MILLNVLIMLQIKAVSMKIKAGIRYMGDENSIIKKGIYQNKTLSTEFLQDVILKW